MIDPARLHVEVVHALAVVALAIVVLGVVRVIARERPVLRDGLFLLALTTLAVGLRLAVPAGILEQNLRSAEVFTGVDPHTWHYGVALPLLWRDLLGPLRSNGLPALFALQAWTGGLAPAALVVLARTCGLDRVTAALAGLLLALAPVHVRFSHTDAQGIPEVLLLVVGLTAWVRHARAPSLDAALVGGAAVGLAAVTRPEALLLGPLVPLAPVAAGLPVPWRDRRTWAGAAVVLALVGVHVAGVLIWNEAPSLHRAGLSGWPSPLVHGPRHYVGLDPTWTAGGVAVAAILGVLLGPGTARQRLAWAALAALTGAFVLDATWAPAGHDLPVFARHQLRSLPFFAILSAMGTTGLGRRLGRVGVWAVPVAVVVAAAAKVPVDFTRYTMHEELAFLLDHVDDVPDGCAIVTWYPPIDRGLAVGFELSRIAGRDHRWIRLDRGERVPTSGCVWWYRPANCAATTPDAVPDDTAPCLDFEGSHVLRPVVEAKLPARGWQYERYVEDPVRIGFYEVVGRR